MRQYVERSIVNYINYQKSIGEIMGTFEAIEKSLRKKGEQSKLE